jgi:outer membrane protein TolC
VSTSVSRRPHFRSRARKTSTVASSVLFLLACGCTVGPKYHVPPTPAPPAYKEMTPENLKETDGWKEAQPQDSALHGKWWEIFGDPELNALEEQVNI